MPLEIYVDRSACQGAKSCVRRAPRSFSLDSEGRSRVALNPGDDEKAIRDAAAACPHFAITVRDLSTDETP
jgi:ferredoxin